MFDNQYIDIASKHKLLGTAHFSDNGRKMHKRVLNFYVISNNQGITIVKILESCLLGWSIKRVLTISVANASENKHAVD